MDKELGEYDAVAMLSSIGGLQVWPPNQAHTARLDEAARTACSVSSWGTKKPGSKQLGDLLNGLFPSDGLLGLLEDALTGPFTDNVVTLGGDAIVYPGINADGPYLLKVLFACMSGDDHRLPRFFIKEVAEASVSLLALSHQIALRLGHTRYMGGPNNPGGDIEVPPQQTLEALAAAVTFSGDQLEDLAYEVGFDSGSLAAFEIELGREYPGTDDPDSNPLLLKPLARVRDSLVVVSPCSMMHAVAHFILALASEKGLLGELAEGYRSTLWRFVQGYVRLLSQHPLDLDLPGSTIGFPLEETLYEIDTDKVAYIQLVTDDLSGYDPSTPCSTWDFEDLDKRVAQRAEQITDWLTGEGRGYCSNVLVVTVLGSLGRDIVFPFLGEPEGARVLLTNAQDLEIVTQLRDFGELRLWKFAEADHKLRTKAQTLALGFLDLYAVYKAHQDSFYLSDDVPPTHVMIEAGGGRSLRLKALQKADVHVSPRFGPFDRVLVTRFEKDEAIPIYYPEGGIGRILDRLIEGYAQPVWVECTDKAQHAGGLLWTQHVEIADMLAYWLWQLTPSLRVHLERLGRIPLRVNFSLEDALSWTKGTVLTGEILETVPSARTRTAERVVHVEIPRDFQRLLHCPDNRAERGLMWDVMRSFGQMVADSDLDNTLTEEECWRILDIHSPLGPKKRLVGANPNLRIALNPAHAPFFRRLESHDIEEHLDDLALSLPTTRPVGELNDPTIATSVCNELVDLFLNRIKESVRRFSWRSLLKELVSQHEAYWHLKAYEQITTPTNIACYGDVQSHVERLAKDLTQAEETAVALRVLIEIVTAEPPDGNELLSTANFDKLIAMAFHLVNWAMLSDHIHLGIMDYRLSILPSGRIGVAPIDAVEVWRPFTASKTYEQVEAEIRDFAKRFQSEGSVEPDPQLIALLDKAFLAEFGMTWSAIVQFCQSLTVLGFELGSASPSLPYSKLEADIRTRLGWQEDEFRSALELFCLRPRPVWEEAPPGFDAKEDIWPWRNNRRLSYLRRPLIVGPEPSDDPLVFWGPRHVDEALRNLFGLVYSGRYKLQPDSAKEMSDLISDFQEKAGKAYVREVKDWLDSNTGYKPYPEVPIKPGKPLHSDEDLGDVDLLCIDARMKKILAIECKNINFGRNPREIANELERFVGKKGSTDQSWVAKHQNRDEWLRSHLDVIRRVYGLEAGAWHIESVFLVSQEISATYLTDMPLPFLSFPRLMREGLSAFERILR